ncbi:MAG: T9SS type A sorting domain-containing protein, partial [Bacteroidetes bacterium]|nr:T9SS type A sorting domain-containing protein [Bacteroidota bacterium]
DTFNSTVIINTVSTHGAAPIITKLDTNGNKVWLSNASSNHATYCNTLALNGSNVAVAASYNGKLVCTGLDSLYHPTAIGEGYDVSLIALNASTGAFIKLDSISSGFPDNEYATSITADKHSNVYIGGNFSNALYANTDTMSSIGGGSDLFVVKYGYDNCSCTSSPVAAYTHSGTNTIDFTYTGTTTALDSVVWTFGDGTTARGNTASHTYTASGTYYACVAAYTACGSNTHCDSVNTTVGIDKVGTFSNINIYPNPMSNTLVIQHAAPGTQLTLFNLMGEQVYRCIITSTTQQINTAQLPRGTYLLQLRNNNGDKMNRTLIK